MPVKNPDDPEYKIRRREQFRVAKRRQRERDKAAKDTGDRQALNLVPFRAVHEVMPLDAVLEAYANLLGGELLATKCPKCGEWFAVTCSTDANGRTTYRRAAGVITYCSKRCRQRSLATALRQRGIVSDSPEQDLN